VHPTPDINHNMKAYITTCCKEKSKFLGEIPMMERYISERIDSVHQKSISDDVAFFVLSGKFGLLSPTNKIPYYDLILEEKDINLMITKVRHQLLVFGITEATLFANPEWKTYVKVIEEACKISNIDYKFEILSNKDY